MAEDVVAKSLSIREDVRESGLYQAFMKKTIGQLEQAVGYMESQKVDLAGFDEETKVAIRADNKFKLLAANTALADKLIDGDDAGQYSVKQKTPPKRRKTTKRPTPRMAGIK